MPDDGEQVVVDEENLQPAKGILHASDSDSNDNDISSSSCCNGNGNRRRSSSVHFPPDEYIVTAVHTRPSTEAQNIPILYYSAQQIRQFKQKYMHQCRFNTSSCEQVRVQGTSETAVMISADQLHMKPQSDDIRLQKSKAQSQPYWRRKLHRRWQSLSSSKARSCNEENSIANGKAEEISYSYEDLVNYEVPVGKPLDNTTNERRDCNTAEPSETQGYRGIVICEEAMQYIIEAQNRLYPRIPAASSFVKKQCNTYIITACR